jgi:hypothetical protein
MLRRTLALGSCLATVLAVVGCQDQASAPTLTAPRPAANLVALDADSSLLVGIRQSGGENALFGSADVADLEFSDAADRAINPADYVCSNNSPINSWINGAISNTLTRERSIFFTLYNRSADLIPTYEALYFQTTATPQYFGYTGTFTKAMVKVERDVKSFWDIPTDIQVLAMHGGVLLDTARTARTYQLLGLNAPTAMSWATTIRDSLSRSTTMVGGNHPFWTFNAVSFKSSDPTIGKKIVMGDGILEGYQALGYGDVAPAAVFAHEFAHQIQFYHNYRLAGVTAPERTRYNELMADAMSAYFLTHARGEALNQKRVEQFLQVFYQIGDCAFTNSGHHGTPNQRLAAARFGFQVADEFQKQGHILTSAEFYALFVAQYPTIIAPDAH